MDEKVDDSAGMAKLRVESRYEISIVKEVILFAQNGICQESCAKFGT